MNLSTNNHGGFQANSVYCKNLVSNNLVVRAGDNKIHIDYNAAATTTTEWATITSSSPGTFAIDSTNSANQALINTIIANEGNMNANSQQLNVTSIVQTYTLTGSTIQVNLAQPVTLPPNLYTGFGFVASYPSAGMVIDDNGTDQAMLWSPNSTYFNTNGTPVTDALLQPRWKLSGGNLMFAEDAATHTAYMFGCDGTGLYIYKVLTDPVTGAETSRVISYFFQDPLLP